MLELIESLPTPLRAQAAAEATAILARELFQLPEPTATGIAESIGRLVGNEIFSAAVGCAEGRRMCERAAAELGIDITRPKRPTF